MQRLEKREYERYGEQTRPGGHKYEASRSFLNWVAAYDAGTQTGRNLEKHERWLQGIQCPILRIVNEDLEDSIQAVLTHLEQ